MGLREIESTLPPGFRFYPSDEELVCHYLYKKVANERASQGTLVEVDLHAREPWELPDVAKLTANEWYFFSFRDRKYATGSRTNRATKTGYWKATGKDREIRDAATRAIVGMRKTLVFYQGRAPNGIKSGWVMHEFRLDTPHSPPKEDWVLCRVFLKRKGDGDHDTIGSSSPPLACSSHPAAQDQTMSEAYYPDIASSMAPQQHEEITSSSNPMQNSVAMWQYSNASAFDHFPQEVGSRAGDEYGLFFDMGFEDMASNLGAVRFPQGWN